MQDRQLSRVQVALETPDMSLDAELEFRKYWRVIRKHFWSIFALAFAVSVLTYLLLLTMTPIYKAESSIVIEPRAKQRVISIDDVAGGDPSAGMEYFMTQIEVLKSHAVARRVIEQLPANLLASAQNGEAVEPEEKSFWRDWLDQIELPDWIAGLTRDSTQNPSSLSLDPIDIQAKQLLTKLTVTPVRNTHIIKISFEDPNPKKAMMVANLVGQAYISRQVESRSQLAQQGSRWLADRVDKLRQDLLKSEKNITEYMESQGLINLRKSDAKDGSSAGVFTLTADELADRQAKLNEARKVRVELQTYYDQFQGLNGKIPESLASLPGIANDEGIKSLKTQEHEAIAQLKQLESKYGSEHPELRAAESRLRSVRLALERQIELAMSGLKNQLDAARANEDALVRSVEDAKAKVQDITRKDSRLSELQREVETNRNLYEMFFNRLKETTETSNLSSTNATILDEAQPPTVPDKPKKKQITLIVGLLAALVGIALAFLLEQLDTSLKSPEEIEEKLGMPFLGLLPFDQATQGGATISYNDDSLSSFAEAVRSVRTGVIFGTLNHPKPVIMITSASPSEGKTTTIINLTASLAQLKRVLLIEADLRKPQLGKRLNVPPRSPGICNLIYGDEEIGNCIFPVEENFDVIPCGRIPPNPLEMLSSPQFQDLIEHFRTQYDMIIIDAPPVGPVSDPIVLSGLVDSVLFVVRAQKSQVKQVQQAVFRLRRVQAPMTGVILNFADVMRESYYKYNYYNNYYQYGYGYGDYKADKDEDHAV